MNPLHQHYRLLLGLDESWDVADVLLELQDKRVSIALTQRAGVRVACPECGADCSVYDHADQRTWRHLDTMQFETLLTASLPRANCAKCGPKLCAAPWAEPHSRFTLLFEALAIQVLQACGGNRNKESHPEHQDKQSVGNFIAYDRDQAKQVIEIWAHRDAIHYGDLKRTSPARLFLVTNDSREVD